MTEHTIFDARDLRCKTPFGAVASGTPVALTLRPGRGEGWSRAFLRARFEFRDNEVRTLPMPWTGLEGDRDLFSCTLETTDYLGLIWYSFVLERLDGKRLELPERQLTVYDGTAEVPAWFWEGVTYQILAGSSRALCCR